MSEAPARPRDPDLTITPETRPAPRPRAAAPRVRRPVVAPPPPSFSARLPRLRVDALLRHPARLAGAMLALAASVAVAVNALSLQTGRHPAPLFAKAAPEPRPAKVAKPAEPPRDAIGEILKGDMQATASVGPREGAARPPSPSQKTLASLPPPRPKPEAAMPAPEAPRPSVKKAEAAPAAGGPKPDPQIAFAQKALVKLGYGPLAVDGYAGPATRAAIARFERERRLPGTPDVASRTLKELASRSGLKPE
ncbi:peptidoglycan-binding domain-containing protein [Methylobacterium sp. JK268]